MFIAVLLTIAKAWKQPKRPSTEEWIKKMGDIDIYMQAAYVYIYMYICVCVYIYIYYAAIGQNEIIASAATWMDLEMIILSEVSQKNKDTHHMKSLICGI